MIVSPSLHRTNGLQDCSYILGNLLESAFTAFIKRKKINSLLCCYTGSIKPKRATSSGAYLRDSAHEQHCSEETLQMWQNAGCLVSDLTRLGIEL